MYANHPTDRIIIDLDGTDEEVCRTTQLLDGKIGAFKLESRLDLIKQVGEHYCVMADRKAHAIPTKTADIVKFFLDQGANSITIHSASGLHAIRAAVEAASGKIKVFAVTELTSFKPKDLEPGTSIATHFENRALVSAREGVDGIICPARFVPLIKSRLAYEGVLCHIVFACPAIRPAWYPKKGTDDQIWSSPPSEAVRYGADYLIIGRPVTDDPDPAVALDRIIKEIMRAEKREVEKV